MLQRPDACLLPYIPSGPIGVGVGILRGGGGGGGGEEGGHQNQRKGRNKEHPPSYSTSEDQMA